MAVVAEGHLPLGGKELRGGRLKCPLGQERGRESGRDGTDQRERKMLN